jgi:hypothetical protein
MKMKLWSNAPEREREYLSLMQSLLAGAGAGECGDRFRMRRTRIGNQGAGAGVAHMRISAKRKTSQWRQDDWSLMMTVVKMELLIRDWAWKIGSVVVLNDAGYI